MQAGYTAESRGALVRVDFRRVEFFRVITQSSLAQLPKIALARAPRHSNEVVSSRLNRAIRVEYTLWHQPRRDRRSHRHNRANRAPPQGVGLTAAAHKQADFIATYAARNSPLESRLLWLRVQVQALCHLYMANLVLTETQSLR